ncbi:MAG: hypothetical protein BHW58_07165 [Azospirillum sp. 51_20]|nr:MAG: hypothetical protein BHW58_07165 [Azospirillum sp. 51_20]
MKKIKDLFGTAEEVRSPLVVDMDGDGVETVTAEGGVYFDHDANGFKENSGWVGQDAETELSITERNCLATIPFFRPGKRPSTVLKR